MNEQSLEELIATGKVKSALLFKGGMSERDRQIVEWFQAEQDALQARLDAAEAALQAFRPFAERRSWHHNYDGSGIIFLPDNTFTRQAEKLIRDARAALAVFDGLARSGDA